MPKPLAFLAGFCAVAVLAAAGEAEAAGGRYVFDGGTPYLQAQVRLALEASAFDWSAVPDVIVIHISDGAESYSTKGHIWLPRPLLEQDRRAWAEIQHEYAHQVDFYLLTDRLRKKLLALLGGVTWWGDVLGLPLERYGTERFAQTLVWAYWPSPENTLRPRSKRDASAAMPAARFRELLQQLLGVPDPTGRARTQPRR